MPACKKRNYPDPQIAVSELVTFHSAVLDSSNMSGKHWDLRPEARGCVFLSILCFPPIGPEQWL